MRELSVGDSASFSKTVTESDINTYAGLTGDFNSVHINDKEAKVGPFGGRVAHGMLSAGFISAVLGTKLPGDGTVYLSQSLTFLKPVEVGDTITAMCTVKEVMNSEKGIYKLGTVCVNQNSQMVIDGEAVIKYTENYKISPAIERKNVFNQSFYSEKEIKLLGLKSYGSNVLISRNAVLYNPELLEVGSNVRIDDFTTISGKVVIGDYVHIAQFCGLYGGTEGIVMDDFSGLSSRVVVYATSNDYSGKSLTNPTVPDKYKTLDKNAEVHLCKHVVVGTTSVILPGVTIGEGCSVGAMSMISKSLESWGIYVGSPVRRVKDRSKKLLIFETELRDEERRGGVFQKSKDFPFPYSRSVWVEVCVA